MTTCTYCRLPGRMLDPFSGKPCCRVDLELLIGALDYDGAPPSVEQVIATYDHIDWTPDERESWEHIVRQRFGARCACGASETDHHPPSPVTSGCVVSPSVTHRCPCLAARLDTEDTDVREHLADPEVRAGMDDAAWSMWEQIEEPTEAIGPMLSAALGVVLDVGNEQT